MNKKSGWEYFTSCFTENYTNFEGRARRAEYWNFYLFNTLISLLVGAVSGGIAAAIGIEAFVYVGYIYSLIAFLPSLAVTVRRLHDTNKSGWWYLIIFTIIGIVVLFVFLVIEGDQGPNDYGPDPKQSNDPFDEV